MKNTPKATYDAFRASMLTNDDAWKDILTDDVALTGPLAQVKGKEAFIQVNGPFFDSIQSSELLELVESGDKILTRISTTVALPGGETMALEVSEWYVFTDGKLNSLVVYFDTADFRKALGM